MFEYYSDDLILASCLYRVLEVLEESGCDTDSLTGKYNFPEVFHKRERCRIRRRQHNEIIDSIERSVDICGLGLLAGQKETIDDHGFLSQAFFCSPCLRSAIPMIIRYKRLLPQSMSLNFRIEKKEAMLCIDTSVIPFRRIQFTVDEILSSWTKILRVYTRGHIGFIRVNLPYDDPGCPELYEKTFGCSVYFNKEDCKLTFPVSVLDMPNELANKDVLEICLRQCEIILKHLESSATISSQVEAVIMASGSTIPTVSDVAQELGISVRTFYRRLHEEGVTYNGIAERIRRRLAEEYLGETNIPVKEVAYTLGFSEPGNFFRAFKRWFGITPSQYRNGRKLVTE